MKPPLFDYHAPASIDEAVALLGRIGGEARLLAGGQSLIPMMNFRIASPAALIDLNRIPALSYLREEGDEIVIGAMTRQRQIEFSPVIRERLPLLAEAIGHVGHLPTRSRGTIGGSIAHADPAAEIPMALQALDGVVVAQSARGARRIDAADLFRASLTTALEPDEILTEVRFPAMPAGAGSAVEEFSRRHGDFAIAAIACVVVRAGERCAAARVATGGVGPVPARLRAAETVLVRDGLSAAAIDAAAKAAAAAVEPLTDHNASADFRRHLTEVLARRALRRAAARAQ